MFNEKRIIADAIKKGKSIVFPEADFSDRIVEAGKIIAKKKIANVIFIGDESALLLKYKDLRDITIINPKTSALTPELEAILFELRKEKGMTEKKAKKTILDPIYFATMMVHLGYADGMVCGAETPTSDSLRPALQIIKGETPNSVVSSSFILYGKNKLYKGKRSFVLGDCALNISPSCEELAEISISCAKTYETFCGDNPKVAFLSFSTKGSADTNQIKDINKAIYLAKTQCPELVCDGEMQLDCAVDAFVGGIKAPESPVSGCANVLVFPELNSGNICYKAIQRFGGLTAIGPILQGFKKPVNDLSRGCNIKDIILLTAITVLQCK